MRPRIASIRTSLLEIHRSIIEVRDRSAYVSVDQNLNVLEQAVVALEDRRFFGHHGYDWRSMVREVVKKLTLRRHGGASTIDIQLFRTISGRYERTLRRKVREIIGARALQHKLSKVQILRVYLDVAYFGTGLNGSEEVSYELYGKPVSELDVNEATFVASLLVYPKPRVTTSNWQAKVTRRAEYGRLLLRTSQKHLQQIRR